MERPAARNQSSASSERPMPEEMSNCTLFPRFKMNIEYFNFTQDMFTIDYPTLRRVPQNSLSLLPL